MSEATRNQIPPELSEQVMKAVLAEIKADESTVDKADVEEVKKADGLLIRPILAFMEENPSLDINNNPYDDEAIKRITTCIMNTLKWRKEYGIKKMPANDFPTAFFNHNYYMTCKKCLHDGTVILIKNENKHEKVSPQWNKILERFMIYFTETVTSQYFNNGKDVIYLMDFTQFSYKNTDSSLCLTFYDMIGKYYPRITIQNCAIDMPWYAKPMMKLVMKILPPSVSQAFKMMSRKELIDNLGSQFVPVSLGGENELQQPLPPQDRFVSIQEIGLKHGIPESDIEKMIQILGHK